METIATISDGTLTGSEKQVAWATEIRLNWINAINISESMVESGLNPRGTAENRERVVNTRRAAIEQARMLVAIITDASEWIDWLDRFTPAQAPVGDDAPDINLGQLRLSAKKFGWSE